MTSLTVHDSDFLFSLGHNCSYDSAYDSDSNSEQKLKVNEMNAQKLFWFVWK